jgi:hypothetical protein
MKPKFVCKFADSLQKELLVVPVDESVGNETAKHKKSVTQHDHFQISPMQLHTI